MPRRHVKTLLIAAAVVALGALIWINRARFMPLDVGSRAPEYTAFDLNGDSVSLSSFHGDVVLLNLWATLCKPCLKEMPALQRLHEQLSPNGLRIVAVSVDAPPSLSNPLGQTGSEVGDFIKRFGLTFTVLRDPSGRIQRVYQSAGLPSTYVIDRHGRIRRKVLGAAAWDEPQFADQIRALLEP
jgi:peroxiredoxin